MKPTQRTSLGQKFLLLIFGLILTLILLESLLRIGGWIFFSNQEKDNRLSLKRQGEYRILCLGESTTALGGENSYPRQLESILNTSIKNIHFSVINKGIPSGTSTQIVSHLPNFLDEYQPNIVVAMIGINDGPNFPLAKDNASKTWDRILMKSRVYKLFKLVVIHLQNKIIEVGVRKSDENLARIEKAIDQSPTSYDYTKLAGIYRIAHKYPEERKALIKAVKIDPQNFEALAYLGLLYKREAEYAKAVQVLKKSIEYNPQSNDIKIQAYTLMGECYQLQGQYDLALGVYQEAMQKNPRYLWGFGAIGTLFMLQEKYEEAAAFFQRQISIDPNTVEYYEKLAHCYHRLNRLPSAERLLKLGIEKNPESAILYAELGACRLDMKKYAEAEIPLKKSLELNRDSFEGKDINVYALLIEAYQEQGKWREAQKMKERSKLYQMNENTITARNYYEILEMLAKRNIPLIAMQYPLREIDSLQHMLEPSKNIVFVENLHNFNGALEKNKYDEYFTDRFAGDFGHCTPYGNKLIAQNLAQTILDQLGQQPHQK